MLISKRLDINLQMDEKTSNESEIRLNIAFQFIYMLTNRIRRKI